MTMDAQIVANRRRDIDVKGSIMFLVLRQCVEMVSLILTKSVMMVTLNSVMAARIVVRLKTTIYALMNLKNVQCVRKQYVETDSSILWMTILIQKNAMMAIGRVEMDVPQIVRSKKGIAAKEDQLRKVHVILFVVTDCLLSQERCVMMEIMRMAMGVALTVRNLKLDGPVLEQME